MLTKNKLLNIHKNKQKLPLARVSISENLFPEMCIPQNIIQPISGYEHLMMA